MGETCVYSWPCFFFLLQSIAVFSHHMPVIRSFWTDLSIFFLVSCNLFYLFGVLYTG